MIINLSKVTASDVQGRIFCLQSMLPNYAVKEESDPLIIYKLTSDPDTMYMHQSTKQPDHQELS